MDESGFLYEKVAGDLAGTIEAGTLRPGERIPSVRDLSRQRQVSITTVMQAYRLLEDRGLIEVRPQSGYFVRSRSNPGLPVPQVEKSLRLDPAQVSIDEIAMLVMAEMINPNLVQFGAAIPDPDLLPTARLNRILAARSRRKEFIQTICGIPQGSEELRRQIARRSYNYGCQLAPEDLLITAGCMEAISLSLRAVCKPGDLVAIESPTYFNLLQALESQGLRALEIPTHPATGVSLEALRFALEHHPIRACLFLTNFNNPLGSCMPDENKEELVEMLAEKETPLIEDDIHGDLYFGAQRPRVAKSFDKKGLVLLCSSFSKDISPGYRIGWIAPGRFYHQVERLKMATNVGTPILPQLAIAEYLATNGYDHHLRRIRLAYSQKVARMAEAVQQNFPKGTCISSPAGGFVLWIQLPGQVDSLDLYRQALTAGINVVPGYIFAPTPKYRSYIRLNAAYYGEKNAWAVRRLGELTASLLERGNRTAAA